VNDQDDLEESEDFESLEDRIRRGPLLGVLLWTALIAGAASGARYVTTCSVYVPRARWTTRMAHGTPCCGR
jgi:hypothetical protein